MKKLALLFGLILSSVSLNVSAFQVTKEDFVTSILSEQPAWTGGQTFTNSDVKFAVSRKPWRIKTVCFTVDPQLPLEQIGKGMVIQASNETFSTWWTVPYDANQNTQRWCFNTRYGYTLKVFWDDRNNGEGSLSHLRSVSIQSSDAGSRGWATDFFATSQKGKPLVSQQLSNAISCAKEFCTDKSFVAPDGGDVDIYVSTDMPNKRLKFNFSGANLAELFQSLPASLNGSVLCLRSNTAGWVDPSEAYCINFSSNQEMIISLPIDPLDPAANVVDEEFTFAILVPGGQQYWTNNIALFPHTAGLVQSGDNFRVAP